MSSIPLPNCTACDSNSLFEFADRLTCMICGAEFFESLPTEYPEEDEDGD